MHAHLPKKSQTGVSLVELMVALAVVGVLLVSITRLIGDGMLASSSITKLQDLEAAKRTILSHLDCEQTLNNHLASSPPLSCNSTHYTPKKSNGNLLFGPSAIAHGWQFRAYCSNDSLRIDAKSVKPDPLTKKIYDWRDIFRDASALCRDHFQATECPDPVYPVLQAANASGNTCCRNVVASGNPPFYFSRAMCAANESARNGWARCFTGSGSTTGKSATSQDSVDAFVHASQPVFNSTGAPVGWEADCMGANGQKKGGKTDVYSEVSVFCCPR